ncbi:hypothetical protein BDV95DRAFT_649113, partial [Massariosphaeria phaeospora]
CTRAPPYLNPSHPRSTAPIASYHLSPRITTTTTTMKRKHNSTGRKRDRKRVRKAIVVEPAFPLGPATASEIQADNMSGTDNGFNHLNLAPKPPPPYERIPPATHLPTDLETVEPLLDIMFEKLLVLKEICELELDDKSAGKRLLPTDRHPLKQALEKRDKPLPISFTAQDTFRLILMAQDALDKMTEEGAAQDDADYLVVKVRINECWQEMLAALAEQLPGSEEEKRFRATELLEEVMEYLGEAAEQAEELGEDEDGEGESEEDWG